MIKVYAWWLILGRGANSTAVLVWRDRITGVSMYNLWSPCQISAFTGVLLGSGSNFRYKESYSVLKFLLVELHFDILGQHGIFYQQKTIPQRTTRTTVTPVLPSRRSLGAEISPTRQCTDIEYLTPWPSGGLFGTPSCKPWGGSKYLPAGQPSTCVNGTNPAPVEVDS